MEYCALVRSSSFYLFLLRLDESIVISTRAAGCPHCGGTLDRSDWNRKGFGIPQECSEKVLKRHSFQCRSCKKRTTPNSLRWMYYRWFASPLQSLVLALAERSNKEKVHELCELFGISAALFYKWRKWWRETFAEGPFWTTHRFFLKFNCNDSIPDSLLASYESEATDPRRILALVAEFLSRYRTIGRWLLEKIAVERMWTDTAYRLVFI